MKICYIGAAGHIKQSIKYFKALNGAEIVGFAPSCKRENCMSSPDSDIPFFDDYRTMLDTTLPDLAVVSPIFSLTGKVIIECAQRKIDVFAEKPVASSFEELEEVQKSINESSIGFCAMHYLRYTPTFYHAAQLVQSGEIGNVKMITAQKSYKYGTRPEWYTEPLLYGSTVTWVGIHALDWIHHFTGLSFKKVTAVSDGKTPEMAMLCQFELDGGVIASVNIDYYRPLTAESHGDDRIRCVGDCGVIEVNQEKIILINSEGTKEIFPENAPNLLEEFLFGTQACTQEEIFHVTRAAIAAKESAYAKKTITIGDER